MRSIYPAVVTLIEGEGCGVFFPDLKGCAEEGDDLYGALVLAQIALNDWLMFLEDTGKSLPKPTPMKSIALEENQFATLIWADTDEWRAKNARRQA